MKIDEKIPPIRIDAYIQQLKQQRPTKEHQPKIEKADLKEDKVEFSQAAQDVRRARDMLNTISDVREEKVNELKSQINEGTYGIDGNKIAFKMLKSSLIDEIV